MHKTWAGAIFLVAVAAVLTFPMWYSRAEAPPEPVVLPASGHCIEDTETIRRTHMKMLYEWRDSVVRTSAKDRRVYVNSKGEKFEKSLTRTCLGCHQSRATFCDRCHQQASVSITCFQCHTSERVSVAAATSDPAPAPTGVAEAQNVHE
jgi:hypothetical protein